MYKLTNHLHRENQWTNLEDTKITSLELVQYLQRFISHRVNSTIGLRHVNHEISVLRSHVWVPKHKKNNNNNKAITMMRGKSPRSDVQMSKTKFRGGHLGF